VVQGVLLRVAEGRVAAVLGRNGVGKTTLVQQWPG
jgi:ABC-type branched-subunit amino acid transport system ATPase component